MLLTARLTAPAWRGLIQFDEDLYVDKVDKTVRSSLRPVAGLDLQAIRNLGRSLGLKIEEKWHSDAPA